MAVKVTRSRNSLTTRDTATHLFAVGEVVRVKSGFKSSTWQSAGVYRVTRKLPPVGSLLQYHIRSEEEPHERVATQNSLEAVRHQKADGDDIFIDRLVDRDRQDKNGDHDIAMKNLRMASPSTSSAFKRFKWGR